MEERIKGVIIQKRGGIMLKITYIAHSSFFIETDRTCLLFDYYTGTIPKVPVGKKLYVFASHRHGDHYSKKIFDLKNEYKDVHYLLSSDIEKIEDDSISYLRIILFILILI